MKKHIIPALAMTITASAAGAADQVGTTASASGSATSIVIAPLAITHDTGAVLSFGTILANGGGTLTLTTGNVLSGLGAAASFRSSPTSVDSFSVSGEPSRAITITAPTSITLTRSGGTETMSISNITGTTGPATLSTSGSYSFKVAGTLNVGNGQLHGSYSGTYTVTATYN